VVDNFFAETEQVAFCTQNIVPGIDFTNDPLLQGRNFSYLDTQLKRLGSPNFTYLPVNAPKCPIAHFQQDGHMAVANPVTRANYEPNSWDAAEGGPREDPAHGFHSYPSPESGEKRRLRPESFADHYSQARQFYRSQTQTEQEHIADAFTFELSKCDKAEIRTRMLAGLRNVDDDLARQVADDLGLGDLPDPAPAARPVRDDLDESPALSILRNGPDSFAGRKIGVLASDGADAGLIAALREAAEQEGANVEFVAARISGVKASDGSRIEADQQVDGGPSVLYDAVVLLASPEGAAELARNAAARDFVTDAYAHYKFIGYVEDASALLEATGVRELMDDGFVELGGKGKDATSFVTACRQLRFWDRQAAS
jgi:catalase